MKDLITDEMKAKCWGEVSFYIDEPCPHCVLDLGYSFDAKCQCGGSEDGMYSKKYVVPWDTMKDIFKLMVKHCDAINKP